MKFTINKNIIVEALSNAVRALSTKITIPVLNGILLNLTNDGLEVQASDSELTIKTTIEAKNIVNIEKEGRAVLQSRCLLEIIRKMPSEIINFELTDNNNINFELDIKFCEEELIKKASILRRYEILEDNNIKATPHKCRNPHYTTGAK